MTDSTVPSIQAYVKENKSFSIALKQQGHSLFIELILLKLIAFSVVS